MFPPRKTFPLVSFLLLVSALTMTGKSRAEDATETPHSTVRVPSKDSEEPLKGTYRGEELVIKDIEASLAEYVTDKSAPGPKLPANFVAKGLSLINRIHKSGGEDSDAVNELATQMADLMKPLMANRKIRLSLLAEAIKKAKEYHEKYNKESKVEKGAKAAWYYYELLRASLEETLPELEVREQMPWQTPSEPVTPGKGSPQEVEFKRALWSKLKTVKQEP